MRYGDVGGRRTWGLLALLVSAMVVGLLWGPVSMHLRAASLLLRFEGVEDGWAGRVARLGAHPVVERELSLPLEGGSTRARRYAPADMADAPRVLLVHGVHFRGMDEPRLVALARAMAASGLEVLTPHVTSLADFRIEPEAVHHIADAAAWFAAEGGGAPRDGVGVLGISFAGGLALMAAAEQDGDGPIAWVTAVGAHHDLARVGRWYAGRPEAGPDGQPPAVSPHPYGPAVFIRGGLEHFFPSPDQSLAARALERVLHERAREAEALLTELTPPGRAQLRRILSREPHAELLLRLQRMVREEAASLRAVSPRGHLDALRVPVLLLHGSDDPVVPSFETRWIAQELPPGALRAVLVTPLLRHAEAREASSLGDELELVRFLARMLELAG